jgi:RNA polymerase sigma-70 factor (ECF subfamily)
MSEAPRVHELVEHLFRHQAGQMLATLAHIFGLENLDLAEEVVQEALLQALRQWPFQGVCGSARPVRMPSIRWLGNCRMSSSRWFLHAVLPPCRPRRGWP